MNEKNEVQRHLREVGKHLRIASEYVGGFGDCYEKEEILKALSITEKLREQYLYDDIEPREGFKG